MEWYEEDEYIKYGYSVTIHTDHITVQGAAFKLGTTRECLGGWAENVTRPSWFERFVFGATVRKRLAAARKKVKNKLHQKAALYIEFLEATSAEMGAITFERLRAAEQAQD